MGMLFDNELTASCLAGGLGGTRERLDRTIGRLIRLSPTDAQGNPEGLFLSSGCRSPSNAAAITQALRELSDLWQDYCFRPSRFQETERLFGVLKDKILLGFDHSPTLWLEYHRLAQNLNELRLDSSQENSELFF
ncbi:MAG: hypothetical protein LBE38_05730 [Deltaproteobacteria bacterium]|jgi:hypothetical protein|nr:hypothetical protein [Deltaproteobacteria bacterium]